MKTAFIPEHQTAFADEHELLLTPEQRRIYETIVGAVRNKASLS